MESCKDQGREMKTDRADSTEDAPSKSSQMCKHISDRCRKRDSSCKKGRGATNSKHQKQTTWSACAGSRLLGNTKLNQTQVPKFGQGVCLHTSSSEDVKRIPHCSQMSRIMFRTSHSMSLIVKQGTMNHGESSANSYANTTQKEHATGEQCKREKTAIDTSSVLE